MVHCILNFNHWHGFCFVFLSSSYWRRLYCWILSTPFMYRRLHALPRLIQSLPIGDANLSHNGRFDCYRSIDLTAGLNTTKRLQKVLHSLKIQFNRHPDHRNPILKTLFNTNYPPKPGGNRLRTHFRPVESGFLAIPTHKMRIFSKSCNGPILKI